MSGIVIDNTVSEKEMERRRKISETTKGISRKRGRIQSAEEKQRRSEIMKKVWESRTEEYAQELGQKISKSLTGKTQSESHRKANSEGHKGLKRSEEGNRKHSVSLKKAYAEGRHRIIHELGESRKGAIVSEETRQKLSQAQKGKEPWNKGIKTGPQSEEECLRKSIRQKGRKRDFSKRTSEQAAIARANMSRARMGILRSDEAKRKTSETLRRLYLEGKRFVSIKSGYGKGQYYDSPNQGKIWLRSTSEVQRAQELDSEGLSWYYELIRFPVNVDGKQSSYTPDFWIERETGMDIEDVKGWWGEKHKTYRKITCFQNQYPEIDLKIVLRRGFF